MKVDIVKSSGIASYEVPIVADTTTVMDILDYVYSNLDHDLAYLKHSTCRQGLCGRCLVTLDGKQVLACVQTVDHAAESVTIGPAKGNVIKDLVVEGK